MAKRSAEDTIAGYYYQFDRTIQALLDLDEDGEIVIEGIEDIDVRTEDETVAIQCKYHAKTEYNHSGIAKPVRLFLDHFAEVKAGEKPSMNYYFFGHFKEGSEKLTRELTDDLTVSVDFLKENFLTYKTGKTGEKQEIRHYEKLGLDDDDLKDFLKCVTFNVDGKKLEDQNKDIIELLRKEFDNCSYIEAENYFYNNALKVVFETATKSEAERKLSRKDFCTLINKKAFLFNKWFACYKGKRKYVQFIKRNLRSARALNKAKYKFLFIGKRFLANHNAEHTVASVVKNIVEEYFQIGKAFSSKNKVWTVVLDCDQPKFIEYKREIKRRGIKVFVRDSDEDFDVKAFNEDPILNTTSDDRIDKTSFQVKLITFEDFKTHQHDIQNIDVGIFFSGENHEEFFRINSQENCPINRKGFKLFVIEPQDSETIKLTSLADIHAVFDEVISGYDYLRIVTIEPNLVQIEVTKPNRFKNKNESFSIGSYVKITDENGVSIIGMLQSYKIKELHDTQDDPRAFRREPVFILDVQPMGYMDGDRFKRGGHQITIPPNEVAVADAALLRQIFTLGFSKDDSKTFGFGSLSYNPQVDIRLEGNQFFNKHIAIVGSTGAGKSCTVAKILQEGIALTKAQREAGERNNARVIIFDLHGEYREAFPEGRYLSVEDLRLPYWLMSGEELVAMFVENRESNSHNQFSQLRQAITENKRRHNPTKKVDFDTPVYFSLSEVVNYIRNLNRMTIYQKDDELYFGLSGEPTLVDMNLLWTELDFIPSTGNKNHPTIGVKIQKYGGFTGEFDRFVARLENRRQDERLSFIFKSGEDLKTDDLKTVLKQFLGHRMDEEDDNSNVVIVDLSGITFDVLNVAVSLVSRLLFNIMYYSKQLNPKGEVENPILLVYEEAHNYIPKSADARYRNVTESVERIAKEGRKYGISAMIVSQRPSEISETIFSQCNTFVVMRLTNPTDQHYVRRLLPDSVSSITDNLSGLEQREALVMGSSIPIPTILKVSEVSESRRPKSNDVRFIEKWRKPWNSMTEMDQIINSMVKPDC